jgi:hypothetical protein
MPTKRARAPRRQRPAQVGDPTSTVTPSAKETATIAPARKGADLEEDDLTEAVLRYLRRFPNETVNLNPLADELDVNPIRLQLAVERLHARRMVVAPFIEPGRAGGATLTQIGLGWLIDREGGRPRDVPVAFQPAHDHVRASDEAARLPRAQVYGVRRS